MPVLDALFPAKLDGVSRTTPILAKLLLVSLLFLYFLKNMRRFWFKESVGFAITVFIVIYVLYFLASSNSYISDAMKISKTLIWYFGFFFFLDVGMRQRFSQGRINLYFTFAVLLLALLVFSQVTNEAFFRSNRNYAASNYAYYLLFLLPFLFSDKNIRHRAVTFTLISLLVVVSMKRGTMLLYAAMIFYLLLFGRIKLFSGNKKTLILSMAVLAAGLFFAKELVVSNLDSYSEKFSDITEYEGDIYKVGSGRGALYLLPLERWINSGAFNFLFGYGFNSTPDFYPTTGVLSKGFYAHSDFVMLIHDQGTIGLLVLVLFFYALYRKVSIARTPEDKVPLILLSIAFFIKSAVSGFILYEYSIFGFAVLGVVSGRLKSQVGTRRVAQSHVAVPLARVREGR